MLCINAGLTCCIAVRAIDGEEAKMKIMFTLAAGPTPTAKMCRVASRASGIGSGQAGCNKKQYLPIGLTEQKEQCDSKR